jgi:O-antigen/teichoic acid export membrane protein
MVLGTGAADPEPGRPSLAAAAVLTYGTNVLVAVLSLANVFVVARALGPSGRGDVAFLTTIAMLTSNLSTLGVEQANANVAGARPQTRRALATNSLLLAVGFGAVAALFVTGLAFVFPAVGGEVSPWLRWVALGCVPVLILKVYLDLIVRAGYAHAVANAAWLLQPVVNLAVNGILALTGQLSVASALATWVGGQALTVAVLAWHLRRTSGFGTPDLRLARESLGFGLRAHSGRIMTLGNYRLDQWILGAVAGSRELGLYSVAVAWAEALFYLPTALTLVQRPDLVRAAREEAGRMAAKVFRAATLVTAPLALAMVLAAPFLCVTIFGEEFRGAVDDLRVLALGGFGIVALKLFGNALTAQGRPLLATAGTAVAFVLTVALDIALIPSHGGFGAAIASTAAYTAGGVAIGALFCRALGVPVRALVPLPRDARDFARAVAAVRGRG